MGLSWGRGGSSLQCTDSSCVLQASEHVGLVVVAHRLSCTLACGIFLDPGIKPMSPALESEFLTTETPGSFLKTGITIDSTDAFRLFDIHGHISSSKLRLLYPLANNRCVDFPSPVPMLDVSNWVPNSRLHAGDTLARKLKKKKKRRTWCLPPQISWLSRRKSWLWSEGGKEQSKTSSVWLKPRGSGGWWPNVGGGCRRAAQTSWAMYWQIPGKIPEYY